jgi:hypothetical protein
VKNGQLQLVDEVLYSVKKIGGFRDHELMESGDNKQIGMTNVDKQKIEANKWTLLVGIQLLSGVAANPAETEFDVCDKKILNGEFELEVGNTVILPVTTPYRLTVLPFSNIPIAKWSNRPPILKNLTPILRN